MAKEIGADYLIARTGREKERASAQDLSEALGGLPLAHEEAAAYCERLEISFADYRKRFDVAPVLILDDSRHAPAEYHDGMTVAKTFALAIEEAAKQHPAAEPLIVHAALLAPDPIPLFLFSEAREKFGEPLALALAGDGLVEAVAAMRTFALIDRETIMDERDPSITTDAIRLHRLVREVASARCEGERRNDVRRALIAALAEVFDGYGNPGSWTRCVPLTPHLVTSCEPETSDGELNTQRADLLNSAGDYLHGRAAYSGARPLFERALAIREKVLGSEHTHTATSLNDLALVLMAQGDYARARPLHERALVIREKVLGPEHPETAMSLNNLAMLLLAQGDLARARLLLERALAIREKVLGSEHTHTATSLNDLALVLMAQGDLAGARPLLERALAIYEKVLGPERYDTATCLSNLARVLHQTGHANEVEPVFNRTIAIAEKMLGTGHPLTQRYRSNYARLLLDTGRAAAALDLAQAALATHEATSGPNHLWTKGSARITADALAALGRAEEAAALRERYGVEARPPAPSELPKARDGKL
jgi:tetratricopeptide (TPR) repeat protein